MLREKTKLVMGILAHVDAGKTTLSEALLYMSGGIRKMGRVDHQDAFLDNFAMERDRGITIFSKQAEFTLGKQPVVLLDTPGHVDFASEMERTLQVLDYAILVISGADGVQGHTKTLWQLLKQYQIPTFIFVNKMDQETVGVHGLMEELKEKLDAGCVGFSHKLIGEFQQGEGLVKEEEAWPEYYTLENAAEDFLEEIAMGSELMMEEYLQEERVEVAKLKEAIRKREIFPCFFGSALRLEGIGELMQIMEQHMEVPNYGEEFAGRVYKITRDEQGNRLTHIKLTGGSLKVKQVINHKQEGKEGEKIDQIRLYSGNSFTTQTEVFAGDICAVTGLRESYCGEALGTELGNYVPLLEPVVRYQVIIPPSVDLHKVWQWMLELQEENPLLRVDYQEQLALLHVQVMGEVQQEILQQLMEHRYGVHIDFGPGNIVYKESIANVVEGVGHFEPLRHYAEVHLRLEPGATGSGLHFATDCSEDILAKNWQRLILTHLQEKKHVGVLAGGEITDIKITLVSGKAHVKHTEGGDFREATYRAVRNGLKKADSILLEPMYDFRLELPVENLGRAMTDIANAHGTHSSPELEGNMAILCGRGPVSTLADYQRVVTSYTKGYGRFIATSGGYGPCHNTKEVLQSIGYDSESDVANPTGSVFCAHGGGFYVTWDEVERYMHLPLENQKEEEEHVPKVATSRAYRRREASDEELEAIFLRTYGPGKARSSGPVDYDQEEMPLPKGEDNGKWKEKAKKAYAPVEHYLLVDGYNIIFAWEELKELSLVNLEAARQKLMEILSNYSGYCGKELILVFDAYKVVGNIGQMFKYNNIHVVYTKEAETADQYIEKLVHTLPKNYQVTVATSDALVQLIIWGAGAYRMSAQGLYEEVQRVEKEIREKFLT